MYLIWVFFTHKQDDEGYNLTYKIGIKAGQTMSTMVQFFSRKFIVTKIVCQIKKA
jgi:hypothetical protein